MTDITTRGRASASDPDGAPALQLEGVVAGYGDATVLRGVSLDLPRGTAGALLGANGAGKSTTLGTVSGLVRSTRGRVLLGGNDVTGISPHARQGLGLCHVPEGRSVFPSLSVKENILLQAPRGRGDEALELAVSSFPSLGRRVKNLAGTLSGGERQMLAIARAYVSEPTVLLLDEVSLGLAPIVIDEIYEFLARLRKQGVTMLVVEQFVDRALELADQVWVLARGQITLSAPAAEVDRDLLAGHYLGGNK